MVGLLSVRTRFEPRASCVSSRKCKRGSHGHAASSTASHGFVYIMVAYCPHAYASETMPSSRRAPALRRLPDFPAPAFIKSRGKKVLQETPSRNFTLRL